MLIYSERYTLTLSAQFFIPQTIRFQMVMAQLDTGEPDPSIVVNNNDKGKWEGVS